MLGHVRQPATVRGSALPRVPVLVGAIIVLAAAYALVAVRLAPRLFPNMLGPSSPDDTPSAETAELASLQAIEAILASVQQAVRDSEFDKAQTILSAAIEQFPRDQTLRLAQADLLIRLAQPGQNPEASEADRLAYQQSAYDAYLAALEIGPRTPEMEFAAGSLARSLGNSEAAIAHFSAAAAADRTNADYPLHLAQVYFSREEFDQAEAQLAVAVSIDPAKAKAWGMLAEIALRQNEPRLAAQHLERAVAIEPSEPAWRIMQARAYNRLTEPDKALEALAALPDESRFDKAALRLAGQACGLSRQPNQALAIYEQALASGVSDPEIMLDAAGWAERAGNIERALELARQARMAGFEQAENMIRRLQQPNP